MSASVYLENKILDHILNVSTYTPSSTLYVALFTSEDGLETNEPSAEVTASDYSRLAISGSTGIDFSTASDGASSNANAIEFPEATESWGTITHVAIMDAETSGNVLIYGALNESKDIGANDIFRIKAGEFDISSN